MKMSSHYTSTPTTNKHWQKLTGIALVCAIGLGSTTNAFADSRDVARRIHDRLAGIPPTEEVLCAMAATIDANPTTGREDAAKIVMQTSAVSVNSTTSSCDKDGNGIIDNSLSKNAFYSVSLKNFITPWTNVDQTAFAPLNDYTATVIGIIRDDRDFRQVLTGDFVYVPYGVASNYSNTSNKPYELLESQHVDLSQSSNLFHVLQSAANIPGANTDNGGEDRGGVTTTRAAGEAFFSAGTNRRMFRFTMINYMCRDIDQLKDTTRVPDRIRQDVSRSPGGDSSIFLNSCIGCHSGMDPLAGAYAYYDWDDAAGQLTYSRNIHHDLNATPDPIKHKYLINAANFPEGYITTDNSWKNYWREGPNSQLGWKTSLPASSNGINSMNNEIANSEAFAQCQVEKVYTHVCMESPISEHATDIQNITTTFIGDHSLKNVFAATAALCSGN